MRRWHMLMPQFGMFFLALFALQPTPQHDADAAMLDYRGDPGVKEVAIPSRIVRHLRMVDRVVEPPAVVPANTVDYAMLVARDLTIGLPRSTDEHGIATRYGEPGDKYAQQGTACAPHNKINATEHTCAHRWYPCGTILIVENQKTGDRNWCVVRDRGPYGASVFAPDGSKVMITPKRAAWYIKIRAGDLPPDDLCPDGGCVGKWRGILDMSPAVSKGMGHTGWGAVKVWLLRNVVASQRYLAKKKFKPAS